jgi:HKD family nuclease
LVSKIIFQGVTADNHLDEVRELLAVPNPKRVIISTAFMNSAGFSLLQDVLKPLAGVTTVLAGIRNGITSVQGLKAVLESGCSLYAVDTGSRSLLFHPKVYVAKGASEARLILGSANVTTGGLNRNIEASVALTLDLSVGDDKALADDVEKKIDGMIAEYDKHVLSLKDAAAVDALLKSGRVVDESIKAASTPSGTSSNPELDTVPQMILKWKPLPAQPAAPATALPVPAPGVEEPAAPAPAAPVVPAASAGPVAPPAIRELVWQSKPLTRRDLNIPDGDNTNKTGSINLDKGLLADDVDHRHYFRDDVFDALTWHARSTTVDEAQAMFQLVLKGVSYGEFDLAIRHSTSTTSKTYLQRNAVFRLSWGPAATYVGKEDLINRTLSLYRDMSDPTRFDLEID